MKPSTALVFLAFCVLFTSGFVIKSDGSDGSDRISSDVGPSPDFGGIHDLFEIAQFDKVRLEKAEKVENAKNIPIEAIGYVKAVEI